MVKEDIKNSYDLNDLGSIISWVIWKYVVSPGGKMKIEDGIVHVTMPDGAEWNFTVPTKIS